MNKFTQERKEKQMAALDEVYGLCTEKANTARAAEAMTELQRLNEKYNSVLAE